MVMVIFSNFKQAYISINRNKLYKIPLEFRIPTKLVRMMKLYTKNSEVHVRVRNEFSGLTQGVGLARFIQPRAEIRD